MSIYSAFANPPKKTCLPVSYGFLAIILVLLAFEIRWRLNTAESDPYRNLNLVVGLMVLFNHLAFQFRWPPRATLALRVFAMGWVIFGCTYVSYISFARVH